MASPAWAHTEEDYLDSKRAAWEAYEADDHRRAAPLLAVLLRPESETLRIDAACWQDSEILGLSEFATGLAERSPDCWELQKVRIQALGRTRQTSAVFRAVDHILTAGLFPDKVSWLRMQRLTSGLQQRKIDGGMAAVLADDFAWIWAYVSDSHKVVVLQRSWLRRLLACAATEPEAVWAATASAVRELEPTVAELLRKRVDLALNERRQLAKHFGVEFSPS
jgi:hypothetical protein